MTPAPVGRKTQTIAGSTLPLSASASASASAPNASQSSTVGKSTVDEAAAGEILQKEMMARNSLALDAQVEERPLAKLQEELQEAANGQGDSEGPAAENTPGNSVSTSRQPESSGGERHHRKALLKNDDTELRRVKGVGRIHSFNGYISKVFSASGRGPRTIL